GLYISGLKTSSYCSVSFLSCTDRLKTPESVKEIPSFFPLILSLVYNCPQIMRRTDQYFETIRSRVTLGKPKSKPYFPYCNFFFKFLK
ncbi:hypothetical protein BDF21DRAFT_334304, partial [Thamnidium elegans]